jgi:hypothetical protein
VGCAGRSAQAHAHAHAAEAEAEAAAAAPPPAAATAAAAAAVAAAAAAQGQPKPGPKPKSRKGKGAAAAAAAAAAATTTAKAKQWSQKVVRLCYDSDMVLVKNLLQDYPPGGEPIKVDLVSAGYVPLQPLALPLATPTLLPLVPTTPGTLLAGAVTAHATLKA